MKKHLLLTLFLFLGLVLNSKSSAQDCGGLTTKDGLTSALQTKAVVTCCAKKTKALQTSCFKSQSKLIAKQKALLGQSVIKKLQTAVKLAASKIGAGLCVAPGSNTGGTLTSRVSFFIVSLHKSDQVQNGSQADIVLSYLGSPKYPLTAVYDLNPSYGRAEGSTECPKYFSGNVQCGTFRKVFTDEPADRTLTLTGAQGCGGFSSNAVFDYVVYLEDADGKHSQILAAPFTCKVS